MYLRIKGNTQATEAVARRIPDGGDKGSFHPVATPRLTIYVGDTDQRGLDRSPGTDLAFGALTSF